MILCTRYIIHIAFQEQDSRLKGDNNGQNYQINLLLIYNIVSTAHRIQLRTCESLSCLKLPKH
jgi:hypothetical protein